MKKLILLALAAAGIGVLVKNKSEQLKSGAARVTSDPRVQSALATASEKTAPLKEKAAPYAEAVKEKAGPYAETLKEKAAPVADTLKEKAGPYADTVKEKVGAATTAAQEKLHKTEDLTPPDVPTEAAEEVKAEDPVSAPEYSGDPLTDPLPEEPTEEKPAEN
ncbi:hypothetical protein [Nocardioides sp. KR10-350]|uniref:hypothetical protein n=1 Tax=Nocardioides cheoyonin TaxID=3156615 RepID=UPI0032B61ABE